MLESHNLLSDLLPGAQQMIALKFVYEKLSIEIDVEIIFRLAVS